MKIAKLEQLCNVGIWLKLPNGKPVQVTKNIDWKYLVECKDENGNIKEYDASKDLTYVVMTKHGACIDLLHERELYRKIDEYRFFGYINITNRVRNLTTVQEDRDFQFDSGGWHFEMFPGFIYEYVALSDDEIKDIILEDIIYGLRPGLSSSTLLGTSAKGLDNNPNSHNGVYTLNNNKEYYIYHSGGKIKCTEGRSGDNRRVIFECEMDWERFKVAKIRNYIRYNVLRIGDTIDRKWPEIIDTIYETIKDWDRFKLSWEFDDEQN